MASTALDAGVVLAAAGDGKRYGARKQFLELAGKPIIHYSLDVFAEIGEVAEIVLVLPPDDLTEGRELLAKWREGRRQASLAGSRRGRGLCLEVVGGGPRRQDSVLAGIEAFTSGVEVALVHDVARPLVAVDDVRKVLEAARARGAAVVGNPCHDSVKRVRGELIVEELPRDEVWTVQTPQAARVSFLRDAYRSASDREWTDEASALRHLGVAVMVVEGSRENIKITRPGDEAMAEMILRSRGKG